MTWQSGVAAGEALEGYLDAGGSGDDRIPLMPSEVADLLTHCFQRDPAQRPKDMLEIAAALQDIYQPAIGNAYSRQLLEPAKAVAANLNNRAVSLVDLNKGADAEKLWEQALQVEPHHAESTFNWGLQQWRSVRMDDLKLLQTLREMGTSHPGAWLPQYLVAQVHVERGDCAAAVELLAALTGADADTVSVQRLLAWASEHLSNSRRCLRSFEGHADSVNSVCLSGDGRVALSGSSDQTLKLWEVSTGRCLRSFEGHTGGVTSVCWSADGRYALSGSGDHTLKLWEVSTGRCLRSFEGHTGGVTSVCWSADGRYALSGSGDHTLKLWEVSTGRCLRSFEGHTDSVTSVCLRGDGRCSRSPASRQEVTSVCLSVDGRYALSGSRDKTLKLWEVSTGRCLRTFEGHAKAVTSVCLSADGRYALSGSSDKTLKLWFLDWELEAQPPADWEEGARPYLEMFLASHIPYAATLPADGTPSDAEITLALTRRGQPVWTEADFEPLLHTLGCAGYGWLRPAGVRRELEQMTAHWPSPPPLC